MTENKSRCGTPRQLKKKVFCMCYSNERQHYLSSFLEFSYPCTHLLAILFISHFLPHKSVFSCSSFSSETIHTISTIFLLQLITFLPHFCDTALVCFYSYKCPRTKNSILIILQENYNSCKTTNRFYSVSNFHHISALKNTYFFILYFYDFSIGSFPSHINLETEKFLHLMDMRHF